MPKATAQIRALAVDDQADSAESMARLLRALDCSATFVTDPAKAIDAAEAINAELVFLDIGMPSIDGYELARRFRHLYGDAILLVAVTGYTSKDHHRMSREAGFDAHVHKPIDLKIVESILATVIAGRR